jgi:D-alanyl-D-alanine carboxypeptidase
LATEELMSGRVGTASLIGSAALVALCLLVTPAFAVSVPSRGDVQRALDRVVRDGVPGVTAVIHGPQGTERYSAGSANLRRDVPISARDAARVGSITKTFTAALVMKLVASGRLGLDDTVGRWLPGVVPNGDAITVRELVSMSSGLAEYCGIPQSPTLADLCTPPESQMSRRWTPRQLVDIGVSAPPLFAPGEGWAYSNTNFVLLGMIVRKATGHSLRAEYRTRILKPLGLDRTRFPRNLEVPNPHSHGYDVLSAGSLPRDVTRTSPTIAGSAGAMISTPHDLQKFMRALVGGRLLPPRLTREMRIPTAGSLHGTPPSQPLEGGGVATYGLGLEHFTWSHACGVYGHSGDFPGFHALAVSTPNGRRGAAFYVNADALEPPGVIASLEAQRLVACRARFGHIGR